MKRHIFKAAAAAGAMLASCSTHDFSDSYKDPDSVNDRKNEYTQKWIDRYGLFDTEHDWTTLQSVDVEITGEYGAEVETHIYNADPKAGGHLIGFSRTPGRLTLDLPKEATSVYAVLTDGKGGTLLSGEFDVALRSVSIASGRAHAPERSRSAHPVSYFDAMVVCEDLGGIGDYDFNDVVLGLRRVSGTNTLKIMPMAAGGMLHADVYYGEDLIGEIHELIEPGSDVSTMLNTNTFNKIGRMHNVTVPDGFSLSRDWKNIRLVVKDAGETVEITGPRKSGEAPQMFCLGGDWYWPKERTAVDDAYAGFAAWTSDMLSHDWAYTPSEPSKVVTWDVSQVVPNWFAGTTSDGAAYRARINNSATVDVKSGEEYALDPPTTLANMFSGASTLTTLDVAADHFDTSLANNFYQTFNGCSSLTKLDLSNWDTANVTDMGNMFYGCSALTDLNLSGFNTAKVKYLNNMFNGCSSLQNLDISDWDISNVTSSPDIFTGCSSLESVTMNNWLNTSVKSNLRTMLGTLPPSITTLTMRDCDFSGTVNLGKWSGDLYYGIFAGLTSLTTLDVTGWKIPDLTTLWAAFRLCASLETITGINTWDVSNVTSMRGTFYNCTSLKSLDLSNWNTHKVTTMEELFNGCSKLTDLNLSRMNTAEVTDADRMFNGCSSLRNLDISGWDISKVTSSEDIFTDCSSLESVTMNNWLNTSVKSNLRTMLGTLPPSITTLTMRDCDFSGTVNLGKWSGDLYYGIFAGLTSLTTLDVTGWKIPDLTTLWAAFRLCTSLETITGINTWDVSNVTSMRGTFYNCTSLKSLDLSKWNTHHVTTTEELFYGCSKLADLNLSGMNTAEVTDVDNMFYGCSKLKSLDISGWDVSKVTSADDVFADCSSLESVTMNNCVNSSSTSKLERILYSLYPSVKTLTMRDCNFAGTKDLGVHDGGLYYGIFACLSSMTTLDVTGWKIPNLTTLWASFWECNSLETLIGINTWDVSSVTSMFETFHNCSSLKKLDISNWNTSNVTVMEKMFYGCSKLADLNLSGMNIAKVTDVDRMFNGCSSLGRLDISGWDVSKVTSADDVFTGCSSLESVTMNNCVNSSSTSKLERILYSLYPSLKTLTMRDCNFAGTKDLGVHDGGLYYGIFACLSSMTTLDVTGWQTSDLTTLWASFWECNSLETLTGINTWNVSNVTNMTETFYNCTALKSLDISNWDTGKVTKMNKMFYGCSALTDLNISGWDIRNVTNFTDMFYGYPMDKTLHITCTQATKDILVAKAPLPSKVSWTIVP